MLVEGSVVSTQLFLENVSTQREHRHFTEAFIQSVLLSPTRLTVYRLHVKNKLICSATLSSNAEKLLIKSL